MRTITLQVDVTDEEKIFETVPRAEYERALGYLTAWAKDAYPHVTIYSPVPKGGELHPRDGSCVVMFINAEGV